MTPLRSKNTLPPPRIIGISGGSGSGKTTLVRQLIDQTGPSGILVLGLDHYYYDLSHLTPAARDQRNFDHPDALDDQLLITQIKDLIQGKPILRPTYDFATHTRLQEPTFLEPQPVIILDGILSLHWSQLREILDLKIYVDVSDDIRFIRRLQRDIKERGRSLEGVIQQYLTTVKSMHDEFVAKQRFLSDIIISWEDHNNRAVNMLAGMVKNWREEGQ